MIISLNKFKKKGGGSGGNTPDHRYMNGTIDKAGLKAIGWTDEDILIYEQNKLPHYTWQNDQYIVSEENKALYSLEDPNPSSYKDNPNITFVPKKNMESYFAKHRGFNGMKYIKGIPFFDTSNITDASYLFSGCSNLTTVPSLNLSSVIDASGLFSGCSNLTTLPPLDFSSVTIADSLFNSCTSLTTLPPLDLSNVIKATYLFNSCTNLTTLPPLDLSNVTNVSYMFNYCPNLISIPPLNTSSATNVAYLFASCNNLTTVEGIDFSGLTSDLKQLFGYSSNMSKLTRFIVNGKINVSISDEYSIKALTAIDYDSVKSILAAANLTDNTNAKTLAFNRTMTDQNGELAALVSSCTSKGWTITGLTIA